MSDTESQLAELRSSIVERPPVCFGTLPVSSHDCTLFYKKGDSVRCVINVVSAAVAILTEAYLFRCLDLASASLEELKLLSEACDKATFGLNNEDVHDESYRKAGKLDAEDFSLPFNAVQAGLLDVIGTELLEGEDEARRLRAELYKLNVYGKRVGYESGSMSHRL